jgi:hypothetical protein
MAKHDHLLETHNSFEEEVSLQTAFRATSIEARMHACKLAQNETFKFVGGSSSESVSPIGAETANRFVVLRGR